LQHFASETSLKTNLVRRIGLMYMNDIAYCVGLLCLFLVDNVTINAVRSITVEAHEDTTNIAYI